MFSIVGLVSASFVAFSLCFCFLAGVAPEWLVTAFPCPFRDCKFGSTKDRLQEVAILFFQASSFGLHGTEGVPEGIPVCLLVAPLWLWSSLSSPFVREVPDNRQLVGPDILACLPAGPDVLCYVSGADGEVGG